MRVMVIVKASKGSEAGELPSEQLLTEMGQYNEELARAGIMLAGEGLKASSEGARVRFSGKNRTVIDGPFAETKELIAGFWLWKVNSMEEAIEWVKRCPNPMNEDSDIEIRPIFEAEDFGEVFTPELREQEASTRAMGLNLGAVRFENAPERLVAGLNRSYPPEERSNIPNHWWDFVPRLGKIPGQTGTCTYGVSHNFRDGCGFDYLTGVEVTSDKNLPEDFTTIRLVAGRYAVLTNDRNVSEMERICDTIWGQWVPSSGLALASAPWFERYTEEFNPETGTGGMEIWIPLQS